MRLAAVTRVRNECDIIEPFVRHNALFFDRIYIINHTGANSTGDILLKLEREGLPLVLSDDQQSSHYQGLKTTELIKRALGEEKWDFIFPIDADEFIRSDNRAALKSHIDRKLNSSSQVPGLLYLDHYAPTEDDNFYELDAIRRIVHRVSFEETQRGGKTFVPCSLAQDPSLSIGEGNHGLLIDGKAIPPMPLESVTLAHFPVRSVEQFISHVVVGRLAWISREDYQSGWASHIRKSYDRLKAKSHLTITDLTDEAFEAAAEYVNDKTKRTLVIDPLTPIYDRLRYTNLIKVDCLSRILHMSEKLANELRECRRIRLSGL